MLDFAFLFADAADGIFLGLPVRFQAVGLLAQAGKFFINLFQAIARVRVGFLAQSLPLDFKLHDAAFNFVNFCGERIDFHAKSGGGFVNKVDGFIGKEAVRDVALGEHGSGYDGGILDAHAVVNFVALFKTAQNGDGVFHRRFTDIYRLKAPLKRGIFFDVLAIFVERGSTDRAQLTARQSGLEHVGSVHGAFGSACADECVQLIDEEDNLAFGFSDFLKDGFQAVFELATIFRTSDQRREVKRYDALRLQDFGNVAGDDSLRQTFDDGGFADTGLADQDGIVFCAARKNLHYATNLFITADDRIQLASPGKVGEIASILLERSVS